MVFRAILSPKNLSGVWKPSTYAYGTQAIKPGRKNDTDNLLSVVFLIASYGIHAYAVK